MRFAAPFDPRLARVLRRLPLDVATAETCRRLGRAAEGFGLARPGYASVRVHVAAERLRAPSGTPRSRWVRGLRSPARSSPRQTASRRSTVARSAVASSDRAA